MTDDKNWKSKENFIIDKAFEQERNPLVSNNVSLNESSLSKEKSQRKIFLVKAKWVGFDEDKNSKCVEITSEELELLKLGLSQIKINLDALSQENLICSEDIFKKLEALLEKLSSLEELK